MTIETFVRLGGFLHLAILGAAAIVPRILTWQQDLSTLNRFLRHLFWVYGAFIAFTILGLGVISIVNAAAMADGSRLSRSVCLFIAVFWFSRLIVQLFIFETTPFKHSRFLMTGYHGLTAAFLALSAIYGWAAIR